jgi:ABC-type branched-subunit amino acid transport system substrate-binding protein
MRRAVLAFALALTITACGGAAVRHSAPPRQAAGTQAETATPTGPMRVAVLAPLTGEFAPIGQQLVNATAIALFEDEQARFELVPFDTKGTPTGASAAAGSAMRERVDMVIGPLFGRHVGPVRQALQNSNTAILTFTNDTDLAGNNVFVMGMSVEDQIERLAQFLRANNRGRLLVFGPDNAYTQRALNATRTLASRGQVQLVRAVTFAENADFNTISEQVKQVTEYDRRRADWRAYEARLIPQVRQSGDPAGLLRSEAARFPQGSIRHRMLLGMASVYGQHISRGRNQALAEVISRIEGVDASPADDFDAVLLPFGNENLIAVGSMLDLYNAGLPFSQIVGTNLWEQEDLAREPSFHQAWFSAMHRAALEPFAQAYRAAYQQEPNPIAVLGYYAGRVAATAAAERVRPVTPFFVQRPEGFQTTAGRVDFGQNNRMRPPLAIYQVTPEGPSELPTPPAPPAS